MPAGTLDPKMYMLTAHIAWFGDGPLDDYTSGTTFDFNPAQKWPDTTAMPNDQWPWNWEANTKYNFPGHPNNTNNFVFGDGHAEGVSRETYRNFPTAQRWRFIGKNQW